MPIISGGGGGGGGGGTQTVLLQHTTIQHAAILTLPSTPVAISPVPAAGNLLMLVTAVVVGPTVAYTNISGSGNITIQPSATSVISGFWQENTYSSVSQLLGSTGSRAVAAMPGVATLTTPTSGTAPADGADLADYDGRGWVISAFNGGLGNYTGGDPANKLDVYFYYVTVPTT